MLNSIKSFTIFNKMLRTLSRLATIILCLLLTSCGFRPLYTAPGEGCEISYPIKICTILDRNGQILRNYLLDLLTPGGAPLKPVYTLETVLIETIVDTGVNKDATTSRKQAILNATITLKNQKNVVVYCHNINTINSFSILTENYYADFVAEDYSKKEALRLLAEKIKILIAAYFDRQNPCHLGFNK